MIRRTYLDVDGVINSLNNLDGDHWPVPAERITVYECNGFEIHLPDHLPALVAALATCTEIVWCTTWEDGANRWIAPLVGLDTCRVLHPLPGDDSFDWKSAAVLADMAERPCGGAIWIEDFEDPPDPRLAAAGVILVDTTREPGAPAGGGRAVNVLLSGHLEGLGLELPDGGDPL